LPWRRARYATETTMTADPGTRSGRPALFWGLLPGPTASNPEGMTGIVGHLAYAAYGICQWSGWGLAATLTTLMKMP
jgi:hypothetical protein